MNFDFSFTGDGALFTFLLLASLVIILISVISYKSREKKPAWLKKSTKITKKLDDGFYFITDLCGNYLQLLTVNKEDVIVKDNYYYRKGGELAKGLEIIWEIELRFSRRHYQTNSLLEKNKDEISLYRSPPLPKAPRRL